MIQNNGNALLYGTKSKDLDRQQSLQHNIIKDMVTEAFVLLLMGLTWNLQMVRRRKWSAEQSAPRIILVEVIS